ncbi:MotA/TolQ/ExbB proton channel family protein [Arhodomonas aquaeolei]|uniref:MotA/TolQ/ExbB proton channel family protein n=1 Tax=Arhodomonas aquaeolei TaxID=2369 RepID=UPI002169D7D9|nr:MotA/TolQ/ExbB proton channel family protein [Arhodomonas aquaeolei]MCS4504754.1 MotA/TolQ/ExbB proton channel family protein [Arhodomonas aquaeolei]
MSLQTASPGLFTLVEAGGPVLWVLGVLSVVALALIAGKCLQFVSAGLGRFREVEAALTAWRGQARREALETVASSAEPAAPVVAVAMRGTRDPSVNDEQVREEVVRQSVALIQRLRSGLTPLELIAQLSPLLGLLGTVLGMIAAFQQLSAAGSQPDPSVLSGGIWQALLTTAAGLIVAIPALFAHAWLDARVERFRTRLEDAVTRVFTHAAAPADQGAGAATAAPAAVAEAGDRAANAY